MRVGRRQLGRAALGALAAGASGCECNGAPGRAAPRSRPAPTVDSNGEPWREHSIDPGELWSERQHAVVLAVPEAPLLVALHGAGEAARGTVAGARGWRDDYDLDVAHVRASQPPLTSADFHGFVRPERLVALNASLEAEPYQGINVVCPYTPRLADRSLPGSRPYGRWLIEVLLERLRPELRAPEGRARTGIDGVSMGGRLALLIGLDHPEVFGAVGALQPAIAPGEAGWLSALAAKAAATAPLELRLVSSDDDPFLPAVEELSKALDRDKVKHQLVVTPGPHDYVWNQGPGAYELLLWHERVLRGLPAP